MKKMCLTISVCLVVVVVVFKTMQVFFWLKCMGSGWGTAQGELWLSLRETLGSIPSITETVDEMYTQTMFQ